MVSSTSTAAQARPSRASGPRAEASAFGCIDADESGRIREFVEKPADRLAHPTTRADVRLVGQLHLHHEGAHRRIRADAATTTPITTWAATSSATVTDGMAAVYDFHNNGARRHRTRPRLLARRQDAGRVL
jgi:ADP-glucose pyrophosphorylase